MAARASLHYWEEPCISGTSGSGTVFFSGCNLRCVFCQNHNIALGKAGRFISPEHLVEIFLQLQEQGANNINLVTPTHFLPQIVIALEQAKQQGLHLPIVYNTGSYESPKALHHLEGLVDIYLPDLKYFSPELSTAYSHAPDYFEAACAAIAEMYRQVGNPVINEDTGLMQRGLIVRHLLLPGQTKDSKKILRYLHETYGDHIYISIMNQYTPLPQVADIEALNRTVTPEEYDRVLRFAERIGIERGFRQEGTAASESFIPEFDERGL
jgi:putative pyruvate formate lyase activating enzyme